MLFCVQHLVDLIHMVFISDTLSLHKLVLQHIVPFVLVLLDEAVALGKKSLIEMTTRALETGIASEVLMSRPYTINVTTSGLILVLRGFDRADRKFGVSLPWLFLVGDLLFVLLVQFLIFTPVD